MSASLKPLTLQEFLDWERSQELRHEFDGIQPVAMTGRSRMHARIGTRLVAALAARVKAPCEVFGPDLKVMTTGRVRYPDATVVCGASDEQSDLVEPALVCEVVSPTTALTDRRVKAAEYASVATIMVYLLLEQERPEVTIRRRSNDWEAETVSGSDAAIKLPELEVEIPMTAIYGSA